MVPVLPAGQTAGKKYQLMQEQQSPSQVPQLPRMSLPVAGGLGNLTSSRQALPSLAAHIANTHLFSTATEWSIEKCARRSKSTSGYFPFFHPAGGAHLTCADLNRGQHPMRVTTNWLAHPQKRGLKGGEGEKTGHFWGRGWHG